MTAHASDTFSASGALVLEIIRHQAPPEGEAQDEAEDLPQTEAALPDGLAREVWQRITGVLSDRAYQLQFQKQLGPHRVTRDGQSSCSDDAVLQALQHDLNLADPARPLVERALGEVASFLRNHPLEGDWGSARLDPDGAIVLDVTEHVRPSFGELDDLVWEGN